VIEHRSRGPWRFRGKRASARKIMESYRFLDAPPPWRRLMEKYGHIQIMRGGVPVPMATLLRERDPREDFAKHRYQIAFESRFDSQATPTIAERLVMPWEWRP
jgi:hypothetical protein